MAGLGAGAVRSSCAKKGEERSSAAVELLPKGGVLILSPFRISAAAGVAKSGLPATADGVNKLCLPDAAAASG